MSHTKHKPAVLLNEEDKERSSIRCSRVSFKQVLSVHKEAKE